MATVLEDNLRRLVPELLTGLTLENVCSLALLMESDCGLHKSEMDAITRTTTNLDAVTKLCMFTRARGDSSIVSLEKALRVIEKPGLADKLAPDVRSPKTGGDPAGGSRSDDGSAADAKNPSVNTLNNVSKAATKSSNVLSEDESEESLAKTLGKAIRKQVREQILENHRRQFSEKSLRRNTEN